LGCNGNEQHDGLPVVFPNVAIIRLRACIIAPRCFDNIRRRAACDEAVNDILIDCNALLIAVTRPIAGNRC
jgi:hypothetical protein